MAVRGRLPHLCHYQWVEKATKVAVFLGVYGVGDHSVGDHTNYQVVRQKQRPTRGPAVSPPHGYARYCSWSVVFGPPHLLSNKLEDKGYKSPCFDGPWRTVRLGMPKSKDCRSNCMDSRFGI